MRLGTVTLTRVSGKALPEKRSGTCAVLTH